MDGAAAAAAENNKPAPASAPALLPPPPVKASDRGKRDEWSEGGVMCLLEVYEAKWLLRNRAKLKGTDWEDIAGQVSLRCAGTKALKTPIQCKNKIESMKKRYRAESADAGAPSSWQFYSRMDGLLKGATTSCSARPKPGCDINLQVLPKPETEAEAEGNLQLHDSNQDDESNTAPIDVNANANATNNNDKDNGVNDKNGKKGSGGSESDVSAPRDTENGVERLDRQSKRRKGSGSEVAESIQLLAHSILKIEQARMEMYKDSERMRVEADIKRGEMELKRTEIIAKTQLQIAKLFVKRSSGESNKNEGSSWRGELDIHPRREGMGD